MNGEAASDFWSFERLELVLVVVSLFQGFRYESLIVARFTEIEIGAAQARKANAPKRIGATGVAFVVFVEGLLVKSVCKFKVIISAFT